MLAKVYQIITFIFIFVIFLTPKQLDPIVKNTIYIFAVFLLPVLIINIYKFVQKTKKEFSEKNFSLGFFVTFIVVLFLSGLFAKGAANWSYFWLYLSYFVIFVTVGFVFKKIEDKEKFFLNFIAVSFIASLISLYNTLFLHFVNLEREGVGFLWIYYGHNHLASVLLLAIPVNFYLLLKYSEQKITAGLFFLLETVLFIAFFFTYARAATVALASAFLLSVFIFNNRSGPVFGLSSKQKLAVAVVFLLFFLNSILGIEILAGKKLAVIKSGRYTMSKIFDWQRQAFGNFISYPWLGSGPDTFKYVNARHEKLYYFRTDYSHDLLSQTISDTGILGLLSLLGLLLTVFFNFYRRIEDRTISNSVATFYFVLWLGLLASFLNGLADFDWQLPGVLFIFWLMAGLIS